MQGFETLQIKRWPTALSMEQATCHFTSDTKTQNADNFPAAQKCFRSRLPSDCHSDRLLLYTSLSLAWLWIQVFFPFHFFQGFIVQLSMSLLLQNSFCFGISFNNFQWWISPLVMILLTPHLQQETSYILTSGNQREGHLFAIWLGFLQPVCPRYPRLVFSGLIAQISSLLRIWGQQSKKRRI